MAKKYILHTSSSLPLLTMNGAAVPFYGGGTVHVVMGPSPKLALFFYFRRVLTFFGFSYKPSPD